MSTSPAPEATEKTPEQASTKRDALQTVVTVLGLAGVLLTGIQYWAVERYFAQFGVAPEEVGLDTAVLLTRVATALVFLAFLLVPSMLFLPGVLALGVEEGSRRRRVSRFMTKTFRDRPGLHALALATLVGLGWAVLTVIQGPAALFSEGTWIAVWIGWTVFLAPALHLAGRHRTHGGLLRSGLVLFLSAALCMLCLGQAMQERGRRTVESARPGALEQVLGIRPHFVHADFAETAGSENPPDGPMLHLGQSNGIHVLYDCSTSQIVRKVGAQVQLTSPVGSGQEVFARSVQSSCR
ncbi:hypothetical protein A3Q37_03918 [Streptomyces sp. PTY087I2]|nr:hypothetical protein A3Q37_03918 [Streptomyces sp. PTY087I2]